MKLFNYCRCHFKYFSQSGEVTNEERATFDKERNLLYQQLDEKDGEINNQSQLISRLQVKPQFDFYMRPRRGCVRRSTRSVHFSVHIS